MTDKSDNSVTDARLKKFEELQQRRLQMTAKMQSNQAKQELRKERRYMKRKQRMESTNEILKETKTQSETEPEVEAEFNKVKQFFNVNAHLHGAVSHDAKEARSRLEEEVNEAVERADLETAEQLSDALAARNFSVVLHEAFEAKKYAEKKKEEDEEIKAKRKKKLHWGFEAKQRWEMKGNL